MKANGIPGKKYPDPRNVSPLQRQQIQLQICYKPLRTNPFTTYRDETGQWVVVRQA